MTTPRQSASPNSRASSPRADEQASGPRSVVVGSTRNSRHRRGPCGGDAASGRSPETDRMELLLPFAADVIAELALDSPWEAGVDDLVEDLSAALGRDADVVAVTPRSGEPQLKPHGPRTRDRAQSSAAARRSFRPRRPDFPLEPWLTGRHHLHRPRRTRVTAETPAGARSPSGQARAWSRYRRPWGDRVPCRLLATNGRGPVRTTGPAPRPVAAAILKSAADALSPLLERKALLERNAQKEQALVAATRTAPRPARLRPPRRSATRSSRVIALAGDLRAFAPELAGSTGAGDVPRLLERIDIFEGRLHGLDSELRELCESLDAPAIAGRPLEFTLEAEARALANQTGIRADVAISGRMDGLGRPAHRAGPLRPGGPDDVRGTAGHARTGASPGVQRAASSASVSDDGDGFSGRADAPPRRESRSFRLGRHERTGAPPRRPL